jgi:hypothetical protein
MANEWHSGAAARPCHRRAIGAETLGTLFGPGFGHVAVAWGPAIVFTAPGIASFALVGLVLGVPVVPRRPDSRVSLLAPYRDRAMYPYSGVIALQSMSLGLMTVVVPLQLAHLGAANSAAVRTFLGAGALASAIGPVAGRLSDRHSRLLPIAVGMLFGTPALVAEPLTASITAVIVLTLCFTGVFRSISSGPAVALVPDDALHAGLAQASPSVVVIMSAGGSLLGATGGSALGQVTFAARAVCRARSHVSEHGHLLDSTSSGARLRRPHASRCISGSAEHIDYMGGSENGDGRQVTHR